MKPKASSNNVGLKINPQSPEHFSFHLISSSLISSLLISSLLFSSLRFLHPISTFNLDLHFFFVFCLSTCLSFLISSAATPLSLQALTDLQHVSRRWHNPLRHWLRPWHPRARPCLRVRTVRLKKKRTMSRVVNPSESSSLVPRPSSHETLRR